MQLILKRKVAEISLRSYEYLLPLYEAVINAIEAIQETGRNNGEIIVEIIRDTSQLNLDKNGEFSHPIISFLIEDNGIGFNNTNYDAFNDAYTDHKLDKGGKGVGRFTILKAFSSMRVLSNFCKDSKYYQREFTFDLKNEVKEVKELEEIDSEETGSKIRLINFLKPYFDKTNVPSCQIAEKLVEHCLVYFISDKMPNLILIDNFSNEEINLTDTYKNLVKVEKNIEVLNERDEEFKLFFVQKYANKGSHKICYSSHAREVENIQLRHLIPNFSAAFEDEKGKYFLLVYVVGDYLDDNVFEVRNKFKFPKKSVDKDAFHKFSLEELTNFVSDRIELKYQELLNSIEKKKYRKIEKHILTEGAIEYRHLLKNENNFRNIEPNLSKTILDTELHKINYQLEKKHKTEINSILDKKKVENYDEFEKQLKRVMQNEHDFSISKLANYVIRRKIILNVFNQLLGFSSLDEGYKLEKDLHNIIFPMGETNDSIPYSSHNLWLLDEKLTFHTYVASDKKLKSNATVESKSNKEPDLFIFDKHFAFSSDELNQSLMIFEFKRPGRILSGEDRNVAKQLEKYFEDLYKSKSTSYRGELINLRDETPKFGYVICEIDKDLEENLMTWGNFKITPSKSFYKYYDKMNLFIEVMSYQTMLSNVELRHKAFFSQLGIENIK